MRMAQSGYPFDSGDRYMLWPPVYRPLLGASCATTRRALAARQAVLGARKPYWGPRGGNEPDGRVLALLTSREISSPRAIESTRSWGYLSQGDTQLRRKSPSRRCRPDMECARVPSCLSGPRHRVRFHSTSSLSAHCLGPVAMPGGKRLCINPRVCGNRSG